MKEKVNEKGIASCKRCDAFFLSGGSEVAVAQQIPRFGKTAWEKPYQPIWHHATLFALFSIQIGRGVGCGVWLFNKQIWGHLCKKEQVIV